MVKTCDYTGLPVAQCQESDMCDCFVDGDSTAPAEQHLRPDLVEVAKPATCEATRPYQIGNQVPMTLGCWQPAGHTGPHRGQTLDSDDNPISVQWTEP